MGAKYHLCFQIQISLLNWIFCSWAAKQKFHHGTKMKVFRCGQNEPGIVAAGRGELTRGSPRAQQREHSPAVCALKSLSACLKWALHLVSSSRLCLHSESSLSHSWKLKWLFGDTSVTPHTWPCCSDMAKVWSFGFPLWGHKDFIHVPLWSQTCCWPELLQTHTLPQKKKKTKQLQLFSSHIYFPLSTDPSKKTCEWLLLL